MQKTPLFDFTHKGQFNAECCILLNVMLSVVAPFEKKNKMMVYKSEFAETWLFLFRQLSFHQNG
jgi:hypothetical protein